ncbi:glycosyl hydrolase [Streptomyces scopuliridis]
MSGLCGAPAEFLSPISFRTPDPNIVDREILRMPKRRSFLQGAVGAVALGATGGVIGSAGTAQAADTSSSATSSTPPKFKGNGAATPPISAASFLNPPSKFKPATRWWWVGPMSVDESVRELNAIADNGFGEVEIAFTSDVWANDVQRSNLEAVLEAAKKKGIKVSMTMGAAWPVQTPNTGVGTGFSQQELQYGRADVKAGQTFSGPAPVAIDASSSGKAGGKVVAVTAARVVTVGPAATLYASGEKPSYVKSNIKPPATSTILDPKSLQDITARLKSDGTVSWTAPAGRGDWILFAFWQRDAGPYTSAFDKDSASHATQYISEQQIGTQNADLLKAVGGSLFEDSLELNADSLFWAPTMAAEFKKRRGYDMVAYLPLMFQHGMSRYWVPTDQPTPDFELPDQQGAKVRSDYYRLLTDLYVDNHLLVFQDWAKGLGVQHKAQAAYGQDLEPVRSFRELARAGGLVEGESYNAGDRFPIDINHMSWRSALDSHRAITGGAHQAGVTRISTELGAQAGLVHMINVGDYRNMLDKEWAAGITQPFMHGFQYMSIGARWPGKYRFGDGIIDSFNDVNNPQWPMFAPQNGYWARGIQVLETGIPRVDVAVYRDGFLTPAPRNLQRDEGTQPEKLFDGLNLETNGYSFEFIDPVGLAEKNTIGKGLVFEGGPAYQALVVDERAIPLSAAKALLAAVESGVKVVFIGEAPSRDLTYSPSKNTDATVAATIKDALKSKNATVVATQSDAAEALRSLGVTPRVSWAGAHVLTQMRDADGVRYVYLYNPTNDAVSFAPSFEGTGNVQLLDLWNGTIAPAGRYSADRGRTVVPLTIEARGNIVVAIDQRDHKKQLHVVSGSDGVVAVENGVLVLKADREGTYRFKLSNGRTATVVARLPQGDWANYAPRVWNISVEAFTPTGKTSITVPTKLGYQAFFDWRDFAEVAGESGVGTYRGKMDIPENWFGSHRRVTLNLGRVEGTAEVSVNGSPVGSQTLDGTTWDITDQVHAGSNELVVIVRSTMRNAVTKYNKSWTRTQSYGLRGGLKLKPAMTIPLQ